MPALYSHTIRATGTILTANIYNLDHQNHIDNGTPQMMDDYSSNVSQMQAATDPGEAGSESLPTSLAGELERLRFAILDIKKKVDGALTQWYQTPTKTAMVLETIEAAGDLLVGSGNAAVSRLPKGSEGQFLGVLGGAVTYVDGIPTGTIVDTMLETAPDGWLMLDGQEVETSAYPNLFTKIVWNIDKWGRGTPAGNFTADAGSDELVLNSHGLTNGTLVHVANSGGALPGGLVQNKAYYVINATANTFQLSVTQGGAAVDITSAGTGTHSVYKKFVASDPRGRAVIGAGQGAGLTNRTAGDVGGEEAHVLTITEMPAHNHSVNSWFNGTFNSGDAVAGPQFASQNTSTVGGGQAHNNMQPYIVYKKMVKT